LWKNGNYTEVGIAPGQGGEKLTRNVLIADDEPNIVMSLEFLMQRAGYQVRVASNGEDALRLAIELVPDLLLLDVMLPKMSGFEVCQKLRANSACQAMKVIMLTAKGRDTEVAKGLAMGADAYITKPFSTKDLLAQVRQILGDGP
jgi:two-component system, OmpR family, alkaline phosphatase synthesis response regulator PhoP